MADIERKNTDKTEIQEQEKSFAMELILNARNDAKRWFIIAMTILVMWLVTIGGFLLYMNQYDYSSTTEATGVHVLIDSQGNIVAKDVTTEMLEAVERWLIENGKNKNNQSKN